MEQWGVLFRYRNYFYGVKSDARVLIIDDDADLRASLALYLKIHFQKVSAIGDPKDIHEALNQENYDLILLDMNFQTGRNDGQEGLYWLKHLKEIRPEIMVLLITAYADIDLAIESLKSGASDFILKPWQNQKLLAALLRTYELKRTQSKLRQYQLQQDTSALKLQKQLEQSCLNPQSMALLQQARKVADTEANVLLLGENGSGKSLLAQYLHSHSKRRNEPLISVDLGAIPESLFETELFGHKKGAFTDAQSDREGLVAQAEGGTLFLDEIANCSLQSQQKLLLFLESRSYQVVGSQEQRQCNIRLICATNENLPKAIEEGRFRADLYYRINTISLEWPALRNRPEDLPGLAQFFLDKFNRQYQKQLQLRAEDMNALKAYAWPGNIRELSHSIERAVILSDAENLTTSLIPSKEKARKAQEDEHIHFNLEEVEAHHIQKVLRHYEGNISKTAKHLGLNRNTLYRKLDKYQIHYGS
jgi:DNA-binding NtrC family response regulator